MTAPVRLMCLGQCGYALSTPLARARGYGHRCWDKLPAATQAAITAEIRPPQPPAKPRRTKRRTAAAPPGPGRLQLTDDPATARPCWACRGTGAHQTPDPADTEFETEHPCTVCEGSGLADSAGGPILREPWTEGTDT